MPGWTSTDPQAICRAFALAHAYARSDIESNAERVLLDGVAWLDVRPMLDEREHAPEALDLAQLCIQHAAHWRLFVRHPQHAHLVRFLAH